MQLDGDFMKFLAGEARTKAHMSACIVSILEGQGLPVTAEILALRVGVAASMLDMLEVMNEDDPMRGPIETAAKEALKTVSEMTGQDVLGHVEEMRRQYKERREHIEAGDSILKGIDFNLN